MIDCLILSLAVSAPSLQLPDSCSSIYSGGTVQEFNLIGIQRIILLVKLYLKNPYFVNNQYRIFGYFSVALGIYTSVYNAYIFIKYSARQIPSPRVFLRYRLVEIQHDVSVVITDYLIIRRIYCSVIYRYCFKQ